MENKAIFQLEVEVEVEVGAWQNQETLNTPSIICLIAF